MGSVSPSSSSSHYCSHSVSLWLHFLKFLSLTTTPAGGSSLEAMKAFPRSLTVGHRVGLPHVLTALAPVRTLMLGDCSPRRQGPDRNLASPFHLPWAQGLGQATSEGEASICTCLPSPGSQQGLLHVSQRHWRGPFLFTGPHLDGEGHQLEMCLWMYMAPWAPQPPKVHQQSPLQ